MPHLANRFPFGTHTAMADLGLKTLWPDEAQAAGATINVDIVFVHGLRGGRESTWKQGDMLWPQGLLPKDIKHARILTVLSHDFLTAKTAS